MEEGHILFPLERLITYELAPRFSILCGIGQIRTQRDALVKSSLVLNRQPEPQRKPGCAVALWPLPHYS
eukprot:2318630-Pyramimonas_sp.AAC.1